MGWIVIDPPVGYDHEHDEPPTTGPPRCSCGRFVPRGGHCSLEVQVYREGTFLGWEHY